MDGIGGLMRRLLAILCLLTLAVSASADSRALLLRHRGEIGGGEKETYGLHAWSWLDFRALGTLYADSNATTIASTEVRAIRDKAHGRIWRVNGDGASRPPTINDDGVIGHTTSSGYIRFNAAAPEPLWGGDDAAIQTSNLCIMVVARCAVTNYNVYQCVCGDTLSALSGRLFCGFTSEKLEGHYGSYRIINNTSLNVSTYTDGGIHLFCVTREWTEAAKGLFTISIDGTQVASGTCRANANTITPRIGTFSCGFLGGACCEALVFDCIPENLAELTSTLKAKYGIN